MSNEARRTTKEFTPEELDRLRRQRELIAAELPRLAERDRMRKEAQDEPTLSGEFRRAIHSSQLPLAAIASQAEITTVMLDEFLTGERTLRSDVLDRLARILGLRFQPTT